MIVYPKTQAQTAAQALQELLKQPAQPAQNTSVSEWFDSLAPTPLGGNSLATKNYADALKSIPASEFARASQQQAIAKSVAADTGATQKGFVDSMLDEIKQSASKVIPGPIDIVKAMPNSIKYALAGLGALILWKVLR